jgi:hypothetical protein
MRGKGQMTLDEYIFKNGITMRDFADLIGYSVNHMYSIASGTRTPSKRLVFVVHIATSGQVKLVTRGRDSRVALTLGLPT